MFYAVENDNVLRFGDVIKGFVLAASNIKDPDIIDKYQIDINTPTFSVIVSPCCSIGEKTILLTPLIPVWSSYFENKYFSDDLTRINRKMEPQQTVSEVVWGKMSPEENIRRLKDGSCYALADKFVYSHHDLFPKYKLKKKGVPEEIETNYYMIDFKNIFKIHCDKVITPINSPIKNKELQLSIVTRGELRNKITSYFRESPKRT
jgi:hypothetical protein